MVNIGLDLCSCWSFTKSILGPLLLLIYIDDLLDNSTSSVKLFVDNTLLFSVVHDENTSAKKLNGHS